MLKSVTIIVYIVVKVVRVGKKIVAKGKNV